MSNHRWEQFGTGYRCKKCKYPKHWSYLGGDEKCNFNHSNNYRHCWKKSFSPQYDTCIKCSKRRMDIQISVKGVRWVLPCVVNDRDYVIQGIIK